MSENTMVLSQPTETQMSDPVKTSTTEINADPMAFQQEIAKIAAEQGMKIENGQVVPVSEPSAQVQTPVQEPTQTPQAVAQPLQTLQEAAPQPVQVPQKFQTSDGRPDVTKIEKSTVHAEAAYRKYAEIEAQLRQKQNEVNRLRTQPEQQQTAPFYGQSQPQAVQPQFIQPMSFNPLDPNAINNALAQSQNPGEVLRQINLMTFQAAKEQAKAELFPEIQALRAQHEAKSRSDELQRIAEKDPWVFSDDGIKTLGDIRQNKPWLNQAPEPWLEAYRSYKAEQAVSPSQQVFTPTPTAQTPRAPAPAVQAQARTNPMMPPLAAISQSRDATNQFLDQMSPQQQEAFWADWRRQMGGR